jgi:hypothetical protein
MTRGRASRSRSHIDLSTTSSMRVIRDKVPPPERQSAAIYFRGKGWFISDGGAPHFRGRIFL